MPLSNLPLQLSALRAAFAAANPLERQSEAHRQWMEEASTCDRGNNSL